MSIRALGSDPPALRSSVYLVKPRSDPPKARATPAVHVVSRVLGEIGQGSSDVVRREGAAKMVLNICNAKLALEFSCSEEAFNLVWKRHARSLRLIVLAVKPVY
jgi:hypothetical protein